MRDESDWFLGRKRARKAGRRRAREDKRNSQYKWKRGNRAQQQRLLAAGWHLSEHLNALSACAELQQKSSPARVVIPTTFSFIEDPEGALHTIGNLAAAASRTDISQIIFDHKNVKTFDLAAEAVLMRVALEIQRERRNAQIPVRYEGSYPEDRAAFRFASAIGISSYLEAEHRASTVGDSSFRVFQQRQRVPISGRANDPSSEKATTIERFADHIDSCLQSISRRLTPRGRNSLCSYTGEVIDNVEEHAKSRAWFVASYLDTANSPPTCEVSIYNFGRSIADSFSDLNEASFARQLVAPYIEAHKDRGFFQPHWSEADLLTLVALQGGISSKRTGEVGDTRGHGTIDLIEFFEDVFEACKGEVTTGARMALLSGSTYILFDGKYRLTTASDGRQIIAFNSSNSLADAPDRAYVRRLNNVFFPGTMVSIRFPLQQTSKSTAAEVAKS